MKPIIKNSTILITGASSGMGKEIATQFATEARHKDVAQRFLNKQ